MTRRSTWPTASSPGSTATLIDPARASKPKDKPRIERPMPYIRDSFFAGPRVHLAGPDAGRGAALGREVYGVHKHRGLDGQTPESVFAALERDALMPLPPRPFESVVYIGGQGRSGLSRQIREGVVLGAVAAASANR